MSAKTVVGIDIGTYQVKIVVAEIPKSGGAPRVIGRGIAESKGLRHGYIVNKADVVRSLHDAIHQAESTSKTKIKQAYLSIGGVGLQGTKSKGAVVISRADSEITELDLQKVQESAQNNIPQPEALNRQVIHEIPLNHTIDGKQVLGTPLNMKGVKLEAEYLFVTCLENHLNDLIEAVEESGVQVLDVYASPIAASFVTLSKTQKIAGCILANIGAETISLVVFENNIPISLEVFPMGATAITNDIALGLQISLEEAQQIKHGSLISSDVPQKKLDEIVEARLSDMFDLIEGHLKKIGKSGLLPAGIIITGGGSGIDAIEHYAKNSLRLPSKVASISGKNGPDRVKDSTWSVAYGLCILGMTAEHDSVLSMKSLVNNTKNKAFSWVSRFLP